MKLNDKWGKKLKCCGRLYGQHTVDCLIMAYDKKRDPKCGCDKCHGSDDREVEEDTDSEGSSI